MIVIRASILGYCMGVRRAVDLALETARELSDRPVYTLGPLIHNPQAVADLASKGIVPLSEAELGGQADRVRGKAVVIRAHGVPPAIRRRLEEAGARVVDATCPRVIASQRRAAALAAAGRTVILAGDRDHAEIRGIEGYAREGALSAGAAAGSAAGLTFVVGSPEEALRLEPPPGRPVAVIAQTTIKDEEYRAICEALASRFPSLEVVDSICPATEERRAALAELARTCDAIVVVGGRNSANTSRLLGSALALGKPAWLVETAGELPSEAFGYARVGLTAGASTPDELVAEVESALLAGGHGS